MFSSAVCEPDAQRGVSGRLCQMEPMPRLRLGPDWIRAATTVVRPLLGIRDSLAWGIREVHAMRKPWKHSRGFCGAQWTKPDASLLRIGFTNIWIGPESAITWPCRLCHRSEIESNDYFFYQDPETSQWSFIPWDHNNGNFAVLAYQNRLQEPHICIFPDRALRRVESIL